MYSKINSVICNSSLRKIISPYPLRSRIYEFERNKLDAERAKDRKSKIGSGDRSERIRTYNFPQGRVTDHRINLTLHKLDEFLSGEIHEEMNQELRLREQNLKLENLR